MAAMPKAGLLGLMNSYILAPVAGQVIFSPPWIFLESDHVAEIAKREEARRQSANPPPSPAAALF